MKASPALSLRLKRSLQVIAFEVIDYLLLLWPVKSSVPGGVAVIKLDTLGDYVIFHNYLLAIKNHGRFAGKPITLIVNEAHKSLVEVIDANLVENIIYIKGRGEFTTRIGYRWRKMREIGRYKFEAMIHPVANRIYLTESIIRIAKAREKIGMEKFSHLPILPAERRSDRWYTKLIKLPETGVFEFEYQCSFFEKVLGAPLSSLTPVWPDRVIERLVEKAESILKSISTPYCVVSAGAGHAFKEWEPEKLNALAIYLQQKTGLAIVFAGGPGDVEKSKIASRGLSDCYNLAGRTTIAEMAGLIAKSSLVIGNDSSAIHFAAAFGKPALCLTGANHFGWWHPYPSALSPQIITLYPEEIEKRRAADFEGLCREYGPGSSIHVQKITIDQAIEALNKLI